MAYAEDIPFLHPRSDRIGWAAFARAAYYPVLIGQGPRVRARAIEMPEPAGPREGAVGAGPALRLLVTGDSSAAGVGVAHQDEALTGQLARRLGERHRVHFRLVARSGNTTRATLDQLWREGASEVDVAVVGLGVNDMTRGRPMRLWLRDMGDLIDWIQSETGARLVVVSGMPPVHQFPLLPNPLRWALGAEARRRDAALRDYLDRRPGCQWMTLHMDLGPLNMAEDGFHPGPPVYAEWARAAETIIRRTLPRM